MFLASEATRTFTAVEFLFALFQAVALVGVMLWIKLVLYRQSLKETNEAASRSQQMSKPNEGMERPVLRNARTTSHVPLPRPLTVQRSLRNRERRLRKRLHQATAKIERRVFARPAGSHSMPSAILTPTMERWHS